MNRFPYKKVFKKERKDFKNDFGRKVSGPWPRRGAVVVFDVTASAMEAISREVKQWCRSVVISIILCTCLSQCDFVTEIVNTILRRRVLFPGDI